MLLKKVVPVVAICCFLFTGCASIVGKSLFPVNFQSNPDDAKISIKDERGNVVFAGKTPTIVTLAAGESYFHAKTYSVTFSKEGYDDQVIQVKASISGWYFGNILFGGLIGILIVDPITGKMWKLPDAPVFGNLAQKTALNDSRNSLRIVSLDQVPENLRNQMIALK